MSLDIAPTTDDRLAEILSDDALAFVGDLHGRFGGRRLELLRARARARRPVRLPRGDALDPRGRLAGRAAARRLRGPARRDHRPDRPQARHQRAQLRRQGLHGRLRGRELADLAEPGRGPREPDRRDRRHDHVRELGRQAVLAERGDRDAARAPARLAPAGEAPEDRRRAGRRRARRLRPARVPQRAPAARQGPRALPLPAEDGAPPRGGAVERGVQLHRGRARRPHRHDPRHGPDRDAARGVPDGRDPLRAARALVRPQRRPLGLHLLDDQVLPGRPRRSCSRTAPT